jgi:hypothetical protein
MNRHPRDRAGKGVRVHRTDTYRSGGTYPYLKRNIPSQPPRSRVHHDRKNPSFHRQTGVPTPRHYPTKRRDKRSLLRECTRNNRPERTAIAGGKSGMCLTGRQGVMSRNQVLKGGV